MKRLGILSVFLLLLWSCGTPKIAKVERQWYKGNLHTHSYWSDGDEFPEMIMGWYKDHGYDFIGLSDHNTLAAGEKWKLVPKGGVYKDAFYTYLKKYGEDWVEYKEDTGRVSVKLKTFQEYVPLFAEKDKFLIIQSEEITNSFEGKPLHLNVTNVKKLIGEQEGSSVSDVLQKSIDAVTAQRRATGQPMIIHINHPNFYFAITVDDMISLNGERFFEVFNGHPMVNNYGDSTHIGMEEMWDRINIAYLAAGKPLMYGVATDDSHNYHMFGDAYSNSGRGWVMVQADSLRPASLIEAMEAGDFYGSTGVTLSRISREGNKLRVEVAAEEGVAYTIQFIGVKKGEEMSSVLMEKKGIADEFALTEDIVFVRAKVVSDKYKENPFKEGDFEAAWTQPMVYQ
ncbi:histidinol-phosphatase [Imperialibacter roseus]|uniref:Histidinol-phosphatase n=1 Tax=Imperialibacter roseus TaxID=1324217 RepID=A0ABZ0IS69_9BACT|nr:histidinol-phosphatase [Imperialibacter roseus]WOK07591.1 histidinol-phosphatase [Imperialibacter roseus]|tara:strand:- start:21076 stop:22269 length:1194 start_codon:yes stop_codon:yes gene_type:complete